MDSSSSSSFSQYPHLSMINVGNFVSIKLTKANYLMCEAHMRSLIVSQNLVGFIDGQNVAPPQSIIVRPHVRSKLIAEIENPEYQAWRRADLLLKGWIIGSLSEEKPEIQSEMDAVISLHPYQEREIQEESDEMTKTGMTSTPKSPNYMKTC
ncbi:hypothetical protein F0562_023640 [Nyssa sinensis]|uniref:Retrotransposon Copia-like N-terminal domain-containing protein n=1 Tax=Nyssa sinensis TaxID=561372 RepID=A0A5J5BL03_9ASTE|nr:hypothetical protein F0562_023640 [Nyssa sinensis]